MEKIVRIAAGSGGMIDTPLGIIQHLASHTPPDYVIFDHMAEGMMSLYLGQMQSAPQLGYSTIFLDHHLLPFLEMIAKLGVKVISNAGGLNPHGAAKTLKERAAELGLSPRIAVVTGDDLRPMLGGLAAEGHQDMFSGAPWPEKVLAANAYLGAFPIAEALRRGAEIVITGRVVDSALALGPLIHEFGWDREDYDRLSAGTLVGHLLECGAQSSGGTFTDWLDLPDVDNVGFPVAECFADGTFVLTKPEGTGGAVNAGTVSEQILYEVSDPAAYLVPDVACDFTSVRLEQVGTDRVRVNGAVGRAPTGSYKVCAISDAGWKAVGFVPVFGIDAVTKARRVAESVFGRARRITDAMGLSPPKLTHSDLVGAGEMTPHGGRTNSPATEVLARLVYHTDEAQAARIFAFECNTPCMNGSAGSLPSSFAPNVGPCHLLFCFTLPRDRLAAEVTVDEETAVLEPESPRPTPGPARKAPQPDTGLGGGDATVPLVALAYARSGDKGNLFNVGVIARQPEYLPHIRAALTAESVAEWMRHTFDDPNVARVSRFEVPGLHALNFVLHDTQRGSFGTSLRFDAAAKSMGQQLLQIPVAVPGALARRWDGCKLSDVAAGASPLRN
jgi:hypothetical protein